MDRRSSNRLATAINGKAVPWINHSRVVFVVEQKRIPNVPLAAAKPNCVQCVVPAGSMVVWDNSIWHTATSNFSGRDRVGHIAGYGAISARLGRRSILFADHFAVHIGHD